MQRHALASQNKRRCNFLDFFLYVNVNIVNSRSATLPDEDKEMQRSLMERVLQILLEVEKLTPKQKVQVHDGLASIRSNVTDTSTHLERDQSRYVHRFSSIAAQSSQYLIGQSRNSICILRYSQKYQL
jgi:hypothetical protein